MSDYPCHLCGAQNLRIIPQYSKLARVASDCKPWPAGGKLGVCGSCQTAQAVIDASWHDECAQIYGAYTIYHQSNGREQPVFEPATGVPAARSDRLLSNVTKQVTLPSTGRLLDFGCGNGGFLGSFSRLFPGWTISGSEYNDKYRVEVERIPGFEALYTGDAAGLPDGFDAISLIHVLEHIQSPRELLVTLREKLKPGGTLIIQLPYFVENPFVLPVADHATHFDDASIRRLLGSTGFEPVAVTSAWVPKELSVIARIGDAGVGATEPVDPEPLVDWLGAVRDEAESFARQPEPFGVFGTSIAGNWMFSELGDEMDFYVDEDLDRTGRTMNGLPILPPTEVPSNANVYIALPGLLAGRVAMRMGNAPGRYISPR